MPENIFKQISLDILRLHQHTYRLLLATQCNNSAEVHESVYVTLDGNYYVWLPQADIPYRNRQGIFLIEDNANQARLSWIADTKAISPKSSLYSRALHTLQQRIRHTKDSLIQVANTHLLELIPLQGRFTIGNSQDFTLCAGDLHRALYPAAHLSIADL
ncbi:pyridoxamine 5'-phosphate oxidase family protein [Neisseria sp. S1]|uniref:pyridoxamine 5'-phosphate oxidase family protein n=1 Tax=Neisseria sp. S1 TaxID=3318354 RepID=UPI003A88A72D